MFIRPHRPQYLLKDLDLNSSDFERDIDKIDHIQKDLQKIKIKRHDFEVLNSNNENLLCSLFFKETDDLDVNG